MCVTAMIGASLAGSAIKAGAAGKAASAQERAANNDIAFQRETRDLIFDRYEPFYDAGQNALAAYNYEMGFGELPMIGGSAPNIETIAGVRGPDRVVQAGREGGTTMPGLMGPDTYRVNGQTFDTMSEAEAYANANKTGGTPYQGFKATPGYEFRLKQGINALDTSAAGRGQLFSGATAKALTDYGQNTAASEYTNYMNRLAGMTDSGMAAAGGQASAATNTAAGVSNAYSNIGNAQAAGAIGVGNAFANGLNNVTGIMGYQQAMNGGQNANVFSQPWASGGFWG